MKSTATVRPRVIEMVEAAVELWEERRLLDSMDESYRKRGDRIHKEMKGWLDFPIEPADAG